MAKIKTFIIESEECIVEFGAKLSNKDFRQGRSHSGHGKCGFDKCLARTSNRKERYGAVKAIEADLMAEEYTPIWEHCYSASPYVHRTRYVMSEECKEERAYRATLKELDAFMLADDILCALYEREESDDSYSDIQCFSYRDIEPLEEFDWEAYEKSEDEHSEFKSLADAIAEAYPETENEVKPLEVVHLNEPKASFSLCELWEVTAILACMAGCILVGILMIAFK